MALSTKTIAISGKMIYLIHFDEPYHHAQHYIGFVEHDLEARLERHAKGHGSKLMKAVTLAGIEWDVVAIWEDGTRTEERMLKNQKNARALCPICCEEHRERKNADARKRRLK